MDIPASRNNSEVVAYHSFEGVDIYFRSDKIVEIVLQPILYNKSMIDQVIIRLMELKSRQGLYMLIVSHPDSSISVDGIMALFSKLSLNYSSAKAYVIHKKFHFFLSTLCLQVYQPAMPIKFFNNQGLAEDWLKEIMSASQK
jgi:hypothetical protein